jgi:protein-S-isoprenylcysteine O-methyltransferase Ste14
MNGLSVQDFIFTGTQFFLFILYVFNVHFFEVNQFLPDFILGLITAFGLTICLFAFFQMGTYLSPFPRPKANTALITTGIFKYIRHPIYTGIFNCLLCVGLYLHSSSKIILSFLLLFWFYIKSKYEEKLLIQKFSDYMAYKKKTGRFFPRFNL